MKRFRFYAILFALVTFVACSDDFVPVLTTDLSTDTFEFANEGGEQTFLLETNEQWSVGDVPEWITVNVTDAPTTRAESTLFESGKKAVTIVVAENLEYEERSAELTMMSASGNMVKLKVTQEKRPKLITDLESDEISFPSEGGEQSFLLDSNEDWTMNDL
ncbi:MAG: BACON domain-containing protein, partial [Bacteroidales bacterium]|nr:BACON domain-containing protein [Bacteroidales bacterium]